MPGGCDSLFIQKLYDGHSKGQSSHFTKPRTSRSAFQVSHYAGSVQYQSEGFVEKNAEQVAGEHVQLLRTSAVRLPLGTHRTPLTAHVQGSVRLRACSGMYMYMH